MLDHTMSIVNGTIQFSPHPNLLAPVHHKRVIQRVSYLATTTIYNLLSNLYSFTLHAHHLLVLTHIEPLDYSLVKLSSCSREASSYNPQHPQLLRRRPRHQHPSGVPSHSVELLQSRLMAKESLPDLHRSFLRPHTVIGCRVTRCRPCRKKYQLDQSFPCPSPLSRTHSPVEWKKGASTMREQAQPPTSLGFSRTGLD